MEPRFDAPRSYDLGASKCGFWVPRPVIHASNIVRYFTDDKKTIVNDIPFYYYQRSTKCLKNLPFKKSS
ncbi:hypothetical protein C7K40_02710 [Streptococcus pyogenes]|nr:hypothetical protein C7K40_02710 [Streptococcus pyogenes]